LGILVGENFDLELECDKFAVGKNKQIKILYDYGTNL
jgi:hypothetical protein